MDASIQERRGKIDILRKVSETAPASVFAYDPLLHGARLTPAGPFSGRAIFRRGAKPSNRWAGNLSVDFPGRSNVRLAGPGRRASLFHAELHVKRGHQGGERFARFARRLQRHGTR